MGGVPPGLASSISIFISCKSSSEEVAEGNGEHFRLSAGSAPCPCFKSRIPNQAYPLYPRGSPRHRVLRAASPFTSPHCWGCTAAFLGTTASPLRGAFWEDRGLLPEEGSPAGLPDPGLQQPNRETQSAGWVRSAGSRLQMQCTPKLFLPLLHDPSSLLTLHL